MARVMEESVQVDTDGCVRGAWLERPLLPSLRVSRWVVIYALLIVFIVLTRLWGLSTRAYSHDEAIHTWTSWQLFRGQGYVHDPIYHGPLLYHVTAGIYALFGDNDFTGRLGTSLGGIAIAMLPLALWRWLGTKGLLATTLLMAVSPVLMHRSRFIRHDHFAIVANLVLFIAILYHLERPRARYLYIVAAALMFSMAGKETSFITYAIFGTFLAAYLVWQWFRSEDRSFEQLTILPTFDLVIVIGTLILPFASPFVISLLGGDPLDYSEGGILFSLGISLVMFGIGAGIGIWWNTRRWLVCAAIYWGIFFPLYTTMFTNGAGVATGVVGQLGYWLSQHGVGRGGQPWYYYIVLTLVYEFLPLLLALAGMAYYALRGEPRQAALAQSNRPTVPFIPFVIWWTIWAFLIYSWAGEKMPWLMMHIVVPMHLLGGWLVGRLLETDWRPIRARGGLWLLLLVPLLLYTVLRLGALRLSLETTIEALSETVLWLGAAVVAVVLAWVIYHLATRLGRRNAWRMAALGLLTVLLALTLRFAWMATFINPDSAAELLVYAQGAPDAGIVARELEELSRRTTGGLHLSIAHDNQVSWPFVWYLRNYDNAHFFGESPDAPLDAQVVLVGVGNEAAVRPFIGDNYLRREHRLVWWPYQDWYINMRERTFWEGLSEPQARHDLWQVWFYRNWDRPLTDWPYVARFAMYVRGDVAPWMWQTGPEGPVTMEPSPEQDYVGRWMPQTALTSWGEPGSSPGEFSSPKGLAVDAEGLVYVADSQNHRIQVLDTEGQLVREWGVLGSGPGELLEPWGVAVSPEGLVYVADTWNHRVQVFTAEGEYMRSWGAFGESGDDLWLEGVFYGPRDLTFDQESNLYVADTGNKRVLKYDPEGNLVAVVGGVGREPGQLQEPVGLAVGPDGTLYVADTWNWRIQAFDAQLAYQGQWPVRAWDSLSVVNKPYLAVDDQGRVWATDPENYRVLGFEPDGTLGVAFGQFGSDLGGMNAPTGIVVDPQGRLLVSDSENHRILIFEPAWPER